MQNLHNRTHPKIYGRESVNGDFPYAKLENAKKSPILFCRLWKNPELIFINIFSPTFVPKLGTLA